MKLGKLSLATVITVGALTSVASAKPLEEAIKNVDVSGYMRMRYTSQRDVFSKDEGVKNKKLQDVTVNKGTNNKWNFKSELNLKILLDDNFFAVAGLEYSNEDLAHGAVNSQKQQGFGAQYQKDSDITLNHAYLGYSAGNTVITVGRQDVGSFATDDLVGDGIRVVNSDIEGLTLTGAYYNALDDDSDIKLQPTIDAYNGQLSHPDKEIVRKANQNDLYLVGVVGSYDPFSFQTWYTHVVAVADYYNIEAGFNFDLAENLSIGLLGQYGHADSKISGLANSNIYAVKASMNAFGFDGSLGYVNFSTKRAKQASATYEDKGHFISAGEQSDKNYQYFTGSNNLWFATAGYTFLDGKVRLGGDIVFLNSSKHLLDPKKAEKGEFDNQGTFEWVARASYQHTENLKFSTYFSQLKEYGDSKKDRLRFEAKYSF